jgi:hypothetical protein
MRTLRYGDSVKVLLGTTWNRGPYGGNCVETWCKVVCETDSLVAVTDPRDGDFLTFHRSEVLAVRDAP